MRNVLNFLVKKCRQTWLPPRRRRQNSNEKIAQYSLKNLKVEWGTWELRKRFASHTVSVLQFFSKKARNEHAFY